MYELHKNEQYFFDNETLKKFSNYIINTDYRPICCLCVPLLGKKLIDIGIFPADIDILDIDKRFSNLASFVYYNIAKPSYINYVYSLIICDPPFFSLSLSQLFNSIYKLTHFNFKCKILISYLKRRESALLGTFNAFNLKPTGFYPKYQTVDTSSDRNKIEFYSNIENLDRNGWFNILLLK